MNCMMEQTERQLQSLRSQISQLGDDAASQIRRQQLRRDMKELLEACRILSPADKVYLARHPSRPGTADYIAALFTDFFEQQGDRLSGEDGSIYGGIALFHGHPVTVMGHRKGKTLPENLRCNFGMPNPEGYRKALRLMEGAEKFRRPIITFIDTPGAYPGMAAEEKGQGSAIAHCLAAMSRLTVPLIAVVTGEGGSGGALALGMGNCVLMLEHAIYSVLSPEGFSSILWKDSSRSAEAAQVMGLTAQDLLGLGVIDQIIPEPLGGAHQNPKQIYRRLDAALTEQLEQLSKIKDLQRHRFGKYRAMGNGFLYDAGRDSQ